MFFKTGSGVGIHPDMLGPMFLSTLAQLEIYKHPITTHLAPIEYIAPLLQAAAICFANDLDRNTEKDLFLCGRERRRSLPCMGTNSKRSPHA